MLINKNDCILQSDDHFRSEQRCKRFYTKSTWFKFSLINPKGLPGALCIKLRSVYETMLYHHSTTLKMSFEKATEESPRVLPLKIIIQNFFSLKRLP